ncbi:hypothetical protein BGW38_003598 [Lunasporangiospora selenospora]|uniref:Zn(2)-C6 fungal-type domain-containing protein n=1 Tax=Lunasporangiospora selenospora TaxID=979761 RepID=A0A9P6FSG2_9FUNG|nr:hypothetical protein BGW38_003598 [Lunasporangiospora selenospora]
MSTSTLQLPSPPDSSRLDPSGVAAVTYDLKRLKVYSSCLRCRAKKVKCDRKEPCSRCEKHNVECSYRELASVQLDIRQFQRHLTNPKIRKDGAGILTSTATPVLAVPSSTATTPTTTTFVITSMPTAPTSTTSSSPTSTSAESATPTSTSATAEATAVSPSSPRPSAKSPVVDSTSRSRIPYSNPLSNAQQQQQSSMGVLMFKQTTSAGFAESEQEKMAIRANRAAAMERAKVHKIQRKKPLVKTTTVSSSTLTHDQPLQQQQQPLSKDVEMVDTSESVDRVRLALEEEGPIDCDMSCMDASAGGRANPNPNTNANVPIWRAQAVGKHTQTAHEQDMAETFGLAAYLKAREMELSQDPATAGQTIDFEMELERALAQRMPSSFSTTRTGTGGSSGSDRTNPSPRMRRNGYHHNAQSMMPYARPSYCQLSPSSPSGNNARNNSSNNTTNSINNNNNISNSSNSHNHATSRYAQPPPSAQCCCQIAAQQGQALGSCPYSNVSHTGYEKHAHMTESPMAPVTRITANEDAGTPPRIAYSPSYSPSYEDLQREERSKEYAPTKRYSGHTLSTPSLSPPPVVRHESRPSNSSSSSSSSSDGMSKSGWWTPLSPMSSAPLPKPHGSILPLPSLSANASSSQPYLQKHHDSMHHQQQIPQISLSSLKLEDGQLTADLATSPKTELPPIRLPPLVPPTSDLTRFQVEREGDEPIEIECKYNEPNVDAWDMIEQPIPLTTKRERSIKMEMGWILS